MVVDKVNNPTPQDEPWITFDYSWVKEISPGNFLELSSKVHDYLSDPRHQTFCQADLKHSYFAVKVALEDRHVLAFTILGISQLQPTSMPQGSGTVGFTMTELMNVALGPIPPPRPELSLLHADSLSQTPDVCFFMDDIFSAHSDFNSQFLFLRDHFLPRIKWARLRLSFKKLRLFMSSITALGITHQVGGKVNILEDRI